ncbi:MAG: FAD-binding protein [Chloroflexi bacterium]|nr:FAD-binding protein [Chloroflexota bacterium]
MASLVQNNVDVDVLIIGGGLAGCMAAIRASECGVSVLVAEKGNTMRSGCAATGVDHCWTYIPEIHGPQLSVEDLVRHHTEFAGGFLNQDLALYIVNNSFKRILDLERFGVPMRDEDGNFRLVKKIHPIANFLHFAGRDLKVKLTQEVRRRPVAVLNRLMVTEVLVDDGMACGAIGFDTRTGELYVFRARAIVLASGSMHRLYKNPTGMYFNTAFPGTLAGDGYAMAYRAGAQLINMEFTSHQTGPKNFQRCGRGSYTPGGRMVDAMGRPLGAADASRQAGTRFAMDRSAENTGGFLQALQQGRGPVYMDCTSASTQDIDYIKWALGNEGNCSFLTYLEEQGIDLHRNRIEFAFYEARVQGGRSGVNIDVQCESSVKRLFVAGDCIGGMIRSGSPGAFSLGYHAGEVAAEQAKQLDDARLTGDVLAKVAERKALYERMLSRQTGANWQEALLALQNLMDYYAGHHRSESMLAAGLSHLRRLRQWVEDELRADDAHELMRCLEVMNLLDNAEMVLVSARERKESRFGLSHRRVDYPETDNENWLKFLAVQKHNGQPLVSSLPIRHVL